MILTIVLLVLPFSSLAVSYFCFDKCWIPQIVTIPLWLFIFGICGLVRFIIRAASLLSTKIFRDQLHPSAARCSIVAKVVVVLINLFWLTWFVVGNVIVYSKASTVVHNDPNSSLYCQQACYFTAYWIIIVSWIVLVAFAFCFYCAVQMEKELQRDPLRQSRFSIFSRQVTATSPPPLNRVTITDTL